MPRPTNGDGPWGEAIAYWLTRKNWRQADLRRACQRLHKQTNKNTISTAARGLDVSTRVLRIIAEAFEAPLDSVLVSPDRRLANDEKRKMILEITERVTEAVMAPKTPMVDVTTATAPPPQALEPFRAALPDIIEKSKRQRKTGRRGKGSRPKAGVKTR